MIKNINTIKLITALVFIISGVILFKATFVERGMLFAFNEHDPMIYPRCLIVGWLLSSVLYLVMPEERLQTDSLKKSLPGLLTVVAVIAVYIFLFSYLGLVLSTFVFMLLFNFVMGNRKPVSNIAFASLFTFITWFGFEMLLRIPMPRNMIVEMFFY